MEQEIVIAGAGVAGLTAAINLKRAGRAVRVIERNPASGAQRHPDWDAVENWTSLTDFPRFLQEIGVEAKRFRHAAYSSFTVIDPSGKRHEVHTLRPFFYLVKRGSFGGGLEKGLQAQAHDMGIRVEYGMTCPYRYAHIWAGGSNGQGSRIVSTGLTFRTDHPNLVCGIVDANIAPRAYAYLVVVDGEGTLGVVMTRMKKEANHFLQKARETFERHTGVRMEDVHKSGGSGGDLAAYWSGSHDFVIGEAGGFQDFLWGFGIRHALTSGYLAAQAILTGQDWQSLANVHLRPLVRASMVNRWLYDRVPNRGYALLVSRFARNADLNALVSRWYHPRLLHRLLWPLVALSSRREAREQLVGGHYSDRTLFSATGQSAEYVVQQTEPMGK